MTEQQNIPKHWEIKKLGEVCLKVHAVKRKDKQPDEELLYLDIGGIDNNTNKILSHKSYKWREAPSRAQQIVHINDVLFSTVRTYMKNIAVVENKIFDGQIASSGFCVIRANKNVLNPKFIFYYSISQRFLKPLNELQTGSSYPAVRDKDVFTQQIPLPPIQEQQVIVAKIEELLSDLENGKQQLLKAQQQLKVYRQSLLKWAFEKSSNSDAYKLVDVCDFITKGTTPSKDKLFSEKGEIPFLKVYNLTFNGKLDFTIEPTFVKKETHNEFLKRSIVFPDDVLMNIVGPPLGKVSIVPNTYPEWNINQAIVRFRCKEILFNRFLLYFLLSENTIRKYSKKAKATAGQFNLTLEICRDIDILIPPLKEQQQIVEILESKLTVCDKLEETISQSLAQSETLRQSILKRAFEGRLV